MTRALRPDFETARWYRDHVRRFGYGYKALGYGRPASQQKRYHAALSLGALHRRSLLDMGCGFGDLLAFLNARGVQPRYTGVDLCAPMIERCKRRFDRSDAQFVIGDALGFKVKAVTGYEGNADTTLAVIKGDGDGHITG